MALNVSLEKDACKQPRKIYAITYFGRSGSYLLSSLFDGHPNVLTIPQHSAFRFFEEFLKAVKSNKRMSIGDLVFFIVNQHPDLFECGSHKGIPRPEGMAIGVNKSLFTSIFFDILTIRLTKDTNNNKSVVYNMFVSIHIAYALALGRTVPDDFLIVYQKHTTPSLPVRKFIKENIPGLYFIKCVRHPEKTYDSMIYHKMIELPIDPEKRTHIPTSIVRELLQCDSIETTEKEYTFCVRFEDIHEKTEVLMRKLCDICGIEYNSILLETTIDGKSHYFMKNGSYITGTRASAARIDNMKYLSDHDKKKLFVAFRQAYDAWGYTPTISITKESPWTIFSRPTKAHCLAFRIEMERMFDLGFPRDTHLSLARKLWKAMNIQAALYNTELFCRSQNENVVIPDVMALE